MATLHDHRHPSDIDHYVAQRMAERREELGLTLIELADLLDNSVTYQQLGKYEIGKNRVSAGRLYELSKALGVPVEWFFEGLQQ